jgi:ribosomal protein L5
MMDNYIRYIVNTHMYEKFYSNHYRKSYDSVSVEYNLKKININYSVSPSIMESNPFSILSHLMFLELAVGQRFHHHRSKKQLNEFDLKKNHYIGSSMTLNKNGLYIFLEKWLNIYQNSLLHYKGLLEDKEMKHNYLSIGLRNLDLFEPLIGSFERWAFMSDNDKYGCVVQFIFNHNNNLLNELFVSHLGFKLYK